MPDAPHWRHTRKKGKKTKTHSLPSASDVFGGQERHSKGSGVNRLDISFDQQVRRMWVSEGRGRRRVWQGMTLSVQYYCLDTCLDLFGNWIKMEVDCCGLGS